jgi:hypothetical protein
LTALGRSKGYELAAVTRFNAIFVVAEDFSSLGISNNSPAALRVDRSLVTHIFCGYDGRVFVRGYGRLPWHDVPYTEILMQPLPGFLREWKERYGPIRSRLFSLYRRARKRADRRR